MPHLVYLAYGFPPAAKSGSYRLRGVANAFAERGWDVTAISPDDACWARDHGLDRTLLRGLHPRVRRLGVPVAREDLEPDLRRWSRERAGDPDGWRKAFYVASQQDFPEALYGPWRTAYRETVEAVHRERPADLLMVSPMPYVMLDAARHLHRVAGVPYAVDYRDGWSVNVVTSEEAFERDSPRGQVEEEVLEHALRAWFVNDRIRDFYAERYPGQADRFRVVRNAFDPDFLGTITHRDPVLPPLVFGYLGVMSLSLPQLRDLLDGWALARQREPLLADARLEFRGHMGAGYAAGTGGHATLVQERARDGVRYLGTVPKTEVAQVYSGWDAMLLAIIGGRYMTSGKVYEYLATGLPIVSAHVPEHDATEVLRGYPLWAPAASLTPEDLASAFQHAARLCVEATPAQRRAALQFAERHSRSAVLAGPVEELIAAVGPVGAVTAEPPPHPPEPVPPPLLTGPRSVVLLAVQPVSAPVVRAAVRDLLAAGHQVRLVSRTNPFAAVHDLGIEFRRLKGTGAGQPRRGTPAWFAGQLRSRVAGPLTRKVRGPRGTWLLLRADGVAWRWVQGADVVVALDRYGAFAAWKVAQGRPALHAVLGLTEARLRLLPGPRSDEPAAAASG